MIDYLQQHIKLLIIAGAIIILILVGVLFALNKNNSTQNNNSTQTISKDGLIINSSNQFLLNESLSKQDKYLMLLGQEMTENFGTYELGNTLPLISLQQQSTEAFGKKVQVLIDSTKVTSNFRTVVDTNTFKLERINDLTVNVRMNATKTDKNLNKKFNLVSVVNFVKQGDYWLVDNITFSNR